MICSTCGKEIEFYGCNCEVFKHAVKEYHIHVGMESRIGGVGGPKITFCPFCGKKLQSLLVYKDSSSDNPDCRYCGGQMEKKRTKSRVF